MLAQLLLYITLDNVEGGSPREGKRERGGGRGQREGEKEREGGGWATMLDMLISNNKEQRWLRCIFIV